MIPYLSGKALEKSPLKQIKEELRKRGYSEKTIKEILKWYR